MFWVIVCTVLAAAGLFAAGWALFGWCVLPQRREAVTVVLAGGEETPETEALARQLAKAYACVEYVSCSECYGGSG